MLLVKESTLAEVQAALTDEPAPLRTVHQRVDCWAKGYIGQALRQLVRENRAVAVGEFKTRAYRAA